jgi:hypothetical protein
MSIQLHQATEEQLRKRLEQVTTDAIKMVTTIIIRPDRDAENPRTARDNVGFMFCKHRNYQLGDVGADDPYEDVEGKEFGGQWMTEDEVDIAREFMGEMSTLDEFWGLGDYGAQASNEAITEVWVELADAEWETRRQLRDDVAVILPLYLYDHSGITVSVGAFGCSWDSGQVGWIYVTKDKLAEEWDGDVAKAESYLKGEVETYDQFLTGDIYGFEIWEHEEGESPDTGEDVDCCWGFYGSDPFKNGMSEHIGHELHEQLKAVEITY